ncbi:ribosome-recycling factor, partial [candidate division KSB1 bacterium]|nr:ribosome-recycling factor [candidate division KSB1 bacterium]NIW68801.1 ribosome recycling factor [candidate division KSB1 bacterium]NIX70387.1 ribosome recycling factor [candidate division KSB1 bacterium]
IEQAINAADLGVSVAADDAGLRVFFPELTSERRDAFVKVVKERLEDARISLRRHREEAWDDIQKKEKDGELTEDEKFSSKEELQKMVDEINKELEEVAKKKEGEISS